MPFSAEARKAAQIIESGRYLSVKKFTPDLKFFFDEGTVDPDRAFRARLRIKPPYKGVQYVVGRGKTSDVAVSQVHAEVRKMVRAKEHES